MNTQWTDNEKRTFAGLMGWEIDGGQAFKVNEHRIILDAVEFARWNPVDRFTAILRGLTPEQQKQAEDWFEGYTGWGAGYGPLNDYLWLDSHKEEILRAVLTVVTPKER